ncbi:MAG: LacI family DNA-binding transcriptional regulator [Mobilitalea sp.]
MISIKDVSAKCGVSVATVSKALNDHSDIAEATKENVRRIAKEMGYFPNSSARALKTNRTYNIGVLFVDEAQSGLTHEYFANVLDSFKVEADRNGYDITFISKHTGQKNMSYYEHSKYRGVDGVVIACIDFFDPQVVELIRGELPVVTIDHVFDNRSAIISDNVKGMHDLITYIYEMGHRKIAYIHGADSSVTQNRVGSFYKTLGELGIDVSDEYVKSGIYHDPVTTAKITKELLELKDRPTCIIFPDDFSTIGGMNAIKEMGLRIPEDISIAGYDGILLSQVLEPKLTTLQQDTKALGRSAAEKLIALIENPKASVIERVVVEGNVIHGKSVRNLNDSKSILNRKG